MTRILANAGLVIVIAGFALGALASTGAVAQNEPQQAPTRLAVLWNQLRSPLLLLLLFAAAVSVATGEWVDAAIIVAIVLARAAIGYTREYRAQSAAAQLRSRVQVHATVLRGGERQSVPVHDVVPGDSR